MATSNVAKSLFSGFKDLSSEEEGQLDSSVESDPKNFRVNMKLNSNQLQKFLEYYIQTSGDEYLFTKTQLNKINMILHNHYHILSKDLKIFKLYKCLIQKTTQDMHEWIEKDYHCGDVVLEILREVISHQENPKYKNIIKKLRLDEIVSKQISKAEARRQMAEKDRLFNKRNKNFAKKQRKSLTKADPFDSIPLKRRSESSVDQLDDYNKRPKNDEFVRPRMLEDIEEVDEEVNRSFEVRQSVQEVEIRDKPLVDLEETEVCLWDEWFLVHPEEGEYEMSQAVVKINDKRLNPRPLDPRVAIQLKYQGLESICSNNILKCQLERFTIIININCLATVISQSEASILKIQFPKDTATLTVNSSSYLVVFKPNTSTFLSTLEKISSVLIYSTHSEELSRKIFPNKEFLYKKPNNFSADLLLIVDNELSGWNPYVILPLIHYKPFHFTHEVLIHKDLPPLRDADSIASCLEFQNRQLNDFGNFLHGCYLSFVANRFENSAISECRGNLKNIFHGIAIDPTIYKAKVGSGGYSNEKLLYYCRMIEELGGTLDEVGKNQLVEVKEAEEQVSGKWVTACYICYSYVEKF